MRRLVTSVIALLVPLVAATVLLFHHEPQPDIRPVAATETTIATEVPRTPSVRDVGNPRRVVIPAIGVDERLHGVGLKSDGAMAMPDYGDAAWYDEGPRPGAAGPAVVVAHVRGPGGPDVFWDLAKLKVGDQITTTDTLGSTTFVVDRIEQVDKDELPYDRIWSDSDEPLLRLITCAGTPGPNGFPDNTVVYAHAL